MKYKTIALLLLAVSLAASASVLAATDIKAAKGTFEAVCSACHGIDRPLGATKDRAGWEATVRRMAGKTAIDQSDQDVIIDYLTAKDLFGTTCSKCHGTDRPLSKKKDRAGWEATVKRMAGKTAIPEADQNVIIDYLTAVAGQ